MLVSVSGMDNSGPILPVEIVDQIVELSLPPVWTLGIDNMAILGAQFPCPDPPEDSPLPPLSLANRRLYDLASPRLWRRVGLALAPYSAEKLRFLARRPHIYAHTSSLFVSLASSDECEYEDDEDFDGANSHHDGSEGSNFGSPVRLLESSGCSCNDGPSSFPNADPQSTRTVEEGPSQASTLAGPSSKRRRIDAPPQEQLDYSETPHSMPKTFVSQRQRDATDNTVMWESSSESDPDIESNSDVDWSFNDICRRLVTLMFQMPKLRILALDLYDLSTPLPPPLLLALLVRPLDALYLHEFLGHAFHSLAQPLPSLVSSSSTTTTTFPPFTPSNLTILQLSCSTAAERLVPHFPNLKALMIRDNYPESSTEVFARWPWNSIEEFVLLSATKDMYDHVLTGFRAYKRRSLGSLPLRQLVIGGRSDRGLSEHSLISFAKTFGKQPLDRIGLHRFDCFVNPLELCRLQRYASHLTELAITCSPLTVQESGFETLLIPFQKLSSLIIDSCYSTPSLFIQLHRMSIINLIQSVPSLRKITLRFSETSESVQASIPKGLRSKLEGIHSNEELDYAFEAIAWSGPTEFDEWTHCLTDVWFTVPSWA